MTETKRYEIAKVGDFLGVPADRRAVMVAEFAKWLDLIGQLRDDGLLDGGIQIGRFIWIDDGLTGCREIQVRCTVPEPTA